MQKKRKLDGSSVGNNGDGDDKEKDAGVYNGDEKILDDVVKDNDFGETITKYSSPHQYKEQYTTKEGTKSVGREGRASHFDSLEKNDINSEQSEDASENESSENEGNSQSSKCPSCECTTKIKYRYCGKCGSSLASQVSVVQGELSANAGNEAFYRPRLLGWRTPNVEFLLSQERVVQIPGMVPCRPISTVEGGRMWISFNQPKEKDYFLIPNLITQQISEQFSLLLGYSPVEVTGRPISALLPMHLFDSEGFAKYSEELMRKLEGFVGYCSMRAPNVFVKKDGSFLGILFQSIVFLDEKKFSYSMAFSRYYWEIEAKEVDKVLKNRKVEIIFD